MRFCCTLAKKSARTRDVERDARCQAGRWHGV
jgi:hypothetical protein